jgi:hypothetical protein
MVDGCATCDRSTHSHPTSRPVTACVWMRECDAWVWMQYMRLPDPFSSNLKVSEAACVDVGVLMHGYGCATGDCLDFIQPQGQ